MKFKTAFIVLLTVFVISSLIIETECQGHGRSKSPPGDHLIHKVCNLSSFQMTAESNYVIAIATFSDWLKRVTPVFQPLRSKTKTNRTVYA